MADIALLVAEEFEARRRSTHEDGLQAINRLLVSYWEEAERKAQQSLVVLKETEAVKSMAPELREHLQLHQPQSPLGLAAVDGLFSA